MPSGVAVGGNADMLRAHAERDRLGGRCAEVRHANRELASDQDDARGGIDAAGQQIHRRVADEAGDKSIGRAAVNFHRRAHLHDFPLAHDHDAVGQRHRFRLVVGDINPGHADLLLQVLEEGAGFQPQFGVEIAQRFVEQEDLRLIDDRPRQRRALLLPAGKLTGTPRQQFADLQIARDFADAGGAFVMATPRTLSG